MMLVGPPLTGLLQRPPSSQALPLQGFGGAVTGGAGGTVYPVTNTNDSGAGSLRQAVADANADAGPAIVDIRVSGYITLSTPVVVSGSDITITGENAPGVVAIRGSQDPLVSGAALSFDGCNNVLVEHVREGSQKSRPIVPNALNSQVALTTLPFGSLRSHGRMTKF